MATEDSALQNNTGWGAMAPMLEEGWLGYLWLAQLWGGELSQARPPAALSLGSQASIYCILVF